jgi:imidazoleglycerol-phosphate dehydratase
MTAPRFAEVQRNTAETQIHVRLNLDGTGVAQLSTGIGFFDHMLDQVARHGLIDLEIDAKGDLHIDGHHTVEDVGITVGRAMAGWWSTFPAAPGCTCACRSRPG